MSRCNRHAWATIGPPPRATCSRQGRPGGQEGPLVRKGSARGISPEHVRPSSPSPGGKRLGQTTELRLPEAADRDEEAEEAGRESGEEAAERRAGRGRPAQDRRRGRRELLIEGELILDPVLRARLDALCDEGWSRWERFDREVRQKRFHPFVPADYEVVIDALLPLVKPGLKFLEWGSAMGVITMIADFLQFEAYGIELDERLVHEARELARGSNSGARFVAGSFLPTGYQWGRRTGDARLGTIGQGPSGYLELGMPLDEFHIVFAYPWSGEEPIMRDVMNEYGSPDALLLLHSGTAGITTYRGDRVLR